MYTNKIVLITGTSKGTGFEIANHFLKNNSYVIGISRNNPKIENGKYGHFNVDISKPEEVVKCFKEITYKYKKIDIAINNAAILTSQYSMIMPVKNAVDMVNTNLIGAFVVARESAKLMRKNNIGRIINIGSMAASLEPAGDSIYAACKSGLITMSNIMAKEYSSYNITCNTLGITAFETEMLKQLPRHKIDEIIKKLPIPRYAGIDDILNVIDFFASERSSYITAQTVYLGGIN
ncbi:MAG: SDR family NAD(P)-dependent oxidoreductase [Ignavibacteria bacterium]